MSNRRNIQFFYTPHNKSTLIDCSFTVAAADTAGAGVTSLDKGGRIDSVFMHTTATPAVGSPNPAAGQILVNLQDNYNKFLGFDWDISSPLSGADVVVTAAGAALVVGKVYVITALGTTTAADWLAIGVPAKVTPAVGVSFVAIATGAGTGTGKVQLPVTSGIDQIELVGKPVLMNSNNAYTLGAGQGMQLIFSCFAQGALTAPVAGSVIRLKMYMNDSAIGV